MKKKTLKNALAKLIVVLLIVLVSLISFLGIHKRNLNTWKSILPDYQFSKELSEIRTFEFSVDTSTKDKSSDENTAENTTGNTTENATNTVAEGTTENTDNTANTTDTNSTNTTAEQVPVNDPAVLTKENYLKTKKIVENRLKDFGIADAEVTVNENNGKLAVSVPYEGTTDYSAALASQKGKIEIIDSETKEVLMDRSMIKKASAYYQQANNNDSATATTDDTVSYNENCSFSISIVLSLKLIKFLCPKFIRRSNSIVSLIPEANNPGRPFIASFQPGFSHSISIPN